MSQGLVTYFGAKALVFTMPWWPEWISFNTAVPIFEDTVALVSNTARPCSVDTSFLLWENCQSFLLPDFTSLPSNTYTLRISRCLCVLLRLLVWHWAVLLVDAPPAVSGLRQPSQLSPCRWSPAKGTGKVCRRCYALQTYDRQCGSHEHGDQDNCPPPNVGCSNRRQTLMHTKQCQYGMIVRN